MFNASIQEHSLSLPSMEGSSVGEVTHGAVTGGLRWGVLSGAACRRQRNSLFAGLFQDGPTCSAMRGGSLFASCSLSQCPTLWKYFDPVWFSFWAHVQIYSWLLQIHLLWWRYNGPLSQTGNRLWKVCSLAQNSSTKLSPLMQKQMILHHRNNCLVLPPYLGFRIK